MKRRRQRTLMAVTILASHLYLTFVATHVWKPISSHKTSHS